MIAQILALLNNNNQTMPLVMPNKPTKRKMPGRRRLKIGKPNANQRQRRKRERQLRGGGK